MPRLPIDATKIEQHALRSTAMYTLGDRLWYRQGDVLVDVVVTFIGQVGLHVAAGEAREWLAIDWKEIDASPCLFAKWIRVR